MRQVAVEHCDHRGRRPFLRAVDGRGARRAAQGIGDVAGDRDLDAVELGPAAGGDRCAPGGPGCRRRASRSRPSSSSSRKPSAWPSPAPPSLVALPPMPTITRLRPGGDRRQQQLAGASRGRDQGIALLGRDEHQSRGRRHLDHGGLAVAEQAEAGRRPARRAGRSPVASRNEPPVAATRACDRPLAAVGHRHLVDRSRRAQRGPPRAPSRPRPRGPSGSP